MTEADGVNHYGDLLNGLTVVTISICLIAGPACFGPDVSGKYDRSRKKVGIFHIIIRLIIAVGICATFYGFPHTTLPAAPAREDVGPPGAQHPANATHTETKEEPNRIVAAPETIQIMIPINGESFKVSFLPKVTPLEVAVELCDSLSEKYGLTSQSYHSSCVVPVQQHVTKEVKAHYRRKSKLMMAEAAGKRAEMAKRGTEPQGVTSSEVSGARLMRSEPPETSSAVGDRSATPDSRRSSGGGLQETSLNSMHQSSGSVKSPVRESSVVSPQVSAAVRPATLAEPSTGVQPEAPRGSNEQNAAAKAKAKAAVESARQRQALKTAAKKRPSDSSRGPQEETPLVPTDMVVRSAEEIATARAAVEHEQRLRREKEMADRIKFVDKRSQARLAALKAKAADREEREKMMEKN